MKSKGSSMIQLLPCRYWGAAADVGQRVSLPYQGEYIDATVVYATNGFYKPGFAELTGLCRADDGRYFVAREIEAQDWCLESGQSQRFELPGPGSWLRVKRVNRTGALLFALQHAEPALRDDLAAALQATPGFSDLNSEAGYLLQGYVQSRQVDPRDALSGAVIMAFSADGFCDEDAVEFARDIRLEEQKNDEPATGGCTVRCSSPDGSHPWEVNLTPAVTAGVEERAQAAGQTFGEALIAMITEGIAQDARRSSEAADRPDLALCAAAKPTADDDEDDEPFVTDDDRTA